MIRTQPYAKGRRGGASIVDKIVQELRRKEGDWPRLSFKELRAAVSASLGYNVSDSTIRSAIYSRPELFQKVIRTDGSLGWCLSKPTRREQT